MGSTSKVILIVMLILGFIVIVGYVFLLTGTDFTTQCPEWVKFRADMKQSEDAIYDIRVMEIADRLIIRYDMKDTLDYATVDAIFRDTREFLSTETGFQDVVKLKKKGSLGTIRVDFYNKNNPKNKMVFSSFREDVTFDPIPKDFSRWTIEYDDEIREYDN